MEVLRIYKCLCDMQRLRILNLLKDGPLCVCHLMEILDAEQVKISKQLSYMKKQGLLQSQRNAQWMVYSLTDRPHPLLLENLKCLQDSTNEYPVFQKDLIKRSRLLNSIAMGKASCSPSIQSSIISK
jgi:ArsR family transcriptional regulator